MVRLVEPVTALRAKRAGTCGEIKQDHSMMTVEHMREAWTYALAEIDAAISYIKVGRIGAKEEPRNAADHWLVTLQRDQVEYRALLVDHPAIRCGEPVH